MIENFAVGIDIVDVNRFRNIPYEQKLSFYKNIFTQNEIDYCLKFQDPYIHFAGKFALKEAVKKSINLDLPILKIETFHKELKPFITLIDLKNMYLFKASISHEKNTAIAIVISELVT
jgi:holo-[acyl-carrier protein] synthase|tara:strand:+ start:1082 stop:1435 length:354 start_codon:yes stop_codon:yes gene_type:complete